MTTLEIKRLDSIKTRSNSGLETSISQDQISSSINKASNRNSLQYSNFNTNSKPTSPVTSINRVIQTNDYIHEIPISIIKSPSYNNQLTQKQVNKNLQSPTSHKSIILDSSSNNISITTNPHEHSNLNLNNSDQIADVNTDTLRFNKYGFIQSNKTDELYSNTNNNNNNDKSSSPSSTLNRSSKQDNSFNSNKNNNNYNNNNTTNNNSATSQVNVTNLKDYLQNSDVEEFAEHLPIKVIQLRELKWVEMLKNFDEWMEKRFKKIKLRCRKGIPQSMRSVAWMHLTGAILLKNNKPNYYNECLTNPNKIDISKYIEDIKKDLHRQFPSHEIFMKREGRQMLFNVLKAYAVHNREVGYCQAQGPIAALLLMHMPEEDAFWMLIRISDFYLKEYYKPGLEKVQIDGHALFYLFKRENPTAYKLMVSQGVDPILYMTEWFMCIYARTLPWCTVLRVWDMFFCEGVKVLYRVGLYLMMSAFNDKQKFQRCQQQGMYETLNLLKNLPIQNLKEADLVRDSCLIKVNEAELKKTFEKCKTQFLKEKTETMNNRKQAPEKSSYLNMKKK